MNTIQKKKLDLQVIISYLGLFPIFLISLDLFQFNIFDEFFLKKFSILYFLVIFSFIGAMRWSFDGKIYTLQIIYGFFPSLLSTAIIFLILSDFNHNYLLVIICFFFNAQLIGDYIFCSLRTYEYNFLIKVRLPITMLINLNIFYLISV